eukprot:scaffold72208_cov31-Tisochrysis_lutea.AAC.2
MEAERRGETPSAPPVAVAVPAVVVAEIVSAAYIDPSDPTKLYVQQSPSGEPVKGQPCLDSGHRELKSVQSRCRLAPFRACGDCEAGASHRMHACKMSSACNAN